MLIRKCVVNHGADLVPDQRTSVSPSCCLLARRRRWDGGLCPQPPQTGVRLRTLQVRHHKRHFLRARGRRSAQVPSAALPGGRHRLSPDECLSGRASGLARLHRRRPGPAGCRRGRPVPGWPSGSRADPGAVPGHCAPELHAGQGRPAAQRRASERQGAEGQQHHPVSRDGCCLHAGPACRAEPG